MKNKWLEIMRVALSLRLFHLLQCCYSFHVPHYLGRNRLSRMTTDSVVFNFQTFSRLHSSNEEGSKSLIGTSSSKSVEDMMEKARQLRNEADRAESALQEERRTAKIKKYEPADEFIEEMRQILGYNRNETGQLAELSSGEQEARDRRFIYDRLKSNLPSQNTLLLVVERLFEMREENLRIFREAQKVKDSQPNSSQPEFTIGDSLNSKENQMAKAKSDISESEIEAMRCSLIWEYIISAIEAIAAEDESKYGLSLDDDIFKVNTSSDVIAYRNQRPGLDVTAMSKELRSREKELTLKSMADAARRVIKNLNESGSDSKPEDDEYESYVQETYGLLPVPNIERSKEFNVTRDALMDFIALPRWVPNSLGGLLVTSGKKIDKADIVQLQEDVFDGSNFYVTSKDASSLAAIFRGNILSERNIVNPNNQRRKDDSVSTPNVPFELSESNKTFTDILCRLEAAPNNLSDRVQLFFLEDQEPREEYGRFSNYLPQKAIIAVSTTVQPEQGELRGNGGVALSIISTLATVLLTFSYAVICYALNENLFDASVNNLKVVLIKDITTIMFGIWGIQILHEVAHWIVSKSRGIRIGLPVPVPSMQFGTFGAITPLRSFPENRVDLFDFAISGPLIGFLLSFILYSVGLSSTVSASSETLATFPVVPAVIFKSSFLVGSLTSMLAPKIMLLPLAQPVPIHPFCCIAEVGLYVSALNLLPIGRTDGGRISTSIFGPKSGGLLSLASLALMSIIALTGNSVVILFWGLFVVLFQRAPEIPARDSVSDLDGRRFILYLGILLSSLLTLIPFPGSSAL